VPQREPIFNVPGAVLGMIAIFIAVHVARQWMPVGDANWWLIALAFIPARYSGYSADIPGGEIASFTSFITHAFTHADATHLSINSAWLLAFGSVLCRRIGSLRFLAFTLMGGIAGACAFWMMHPGLLVPVIGASGAVAAMMGGVMRFLFSALDRGEGYLLREAPEAIPLTTLTEALTHRRILLSSALFVGINLLAIVGFGSMGATGTIAWEAHLGGYAFGLLAFGFFDIATHNASPSQAEIE
jgi:membrane associated rhomboid family serine protease